jgi:YggT family protein
MNINPFIDLIGTVLSLYNWVLIIWMILGWLVALNIVNSYQPAVSKALKVLNQLTLPVMNYIRKFVPPLGNLDLSPIILFLMIGFIKNVLYTYFYHFK